MSFKDKMYELEERLHLEENEVKYHNATNHPQNFDYELWLRLEHLKSLENILANKWDVAQIELNGISLINEVDKLLDKEGWAK